MGYVNFPKIRQPHKPITKINTSKGIHALRVPTLHNNARNTANKTCIHQPAGATHMKQVRQNSTVPAVPQIKWDKNSIELNGKIHKLPITKEYMLKEYSDVFKGVGTLPGGPYHIRLKENYRPVQHLLRAVPVAMPAAYRAELDRLTKEGIITEVQEHTEWINSIILVMKPNGSLRLCLDPKDLNKAIKRNQWYSRTIDDILPELAKSKYKMLKDATSGYWYVILDLASSLLTTFNTPWGKFR